MRRRRATRSCGIRSFTIPQTTSRSSLVRCGRRGRRCSSHSSTLSAAASCGGAPRQVAVAAAAAVPRVPLQHIGSLATFDPADGLNGKQFMLGDKIMVALVVASGEDEVSVYFPVPVGGSAGSETWVHWATGDRYGSATTFRCHASLLHIFCLKRSQVRGWVFLRVRGGAAWHACHLWQGRWHLLELHGVDSAHAAGMS